MYYSVEYVYNSVVLTDNNSLMKNIMLHMYKNNNTILHRLVGTP